MRTPKRLFFGASIVALTAAAALAQAPRVPIPAEDLGAALDAYIHQSGAQLIYNADDVRGVTSHAVGGASGADALTQILEGTGFTANRDASGAVIIARITAQTGFVEPPIAESVVVTGSRIRSANEPSTPVLSLAVD